MSVDISVIGAFYIQHFTLAGPGGPSEFFDVGEVGIVDGKRVYHCPRWLGLKSRSAAEALIAKLAT